MFSGILIWLATALRKLSSCYWWITYSGYRSAYSIDRTFRFNGRCILFYGEGRIVAGPDSYIGELSTIQAARGCSVSIGTRCQISHNVRVYTQSHVADADLSRDEPPQKRGDVKFSDYCWIGANVFVGPGVTIGENAVVGANSVVTKDIPAFEIWGGVPARLIRRKQPL
jgi:maltose O-acetyltransferase